jgi:hypothetical protein
MPGAEDIVEVRLPTWGEIVMGWLKPTVLFALLTAVLLFVLYVGSAATNIFFASVGGESLVVARGTFVGNVAPPNSKVYVSTSTPDGANFLSNLKTGFLGVPDPAIVRVRSGLYDRIKIQGGELLVNDKSVGPAGSVTINNGSSAKLSRQYVAECVSGSCGKVGSLLLVPQQNVYGEVKRN